MLKIISILLLSASLATNAVADEKLTQVQDKSEFMEAKEEIREELKSYYANLKELREKRKALWEGLSADAKDFIKKRKDARKAAKAGKDKDEDMD